MLPVLSTSGFTRTPCHYSWWAILSEHASKTLHQYSKVLRWLNKEFLSPAKQLQYPANKNHLFCQSSFELSKRLMLLRQRSYRCIARKFSTLSKRVRTLSKRVRTLSKRVRTLSKRVQTFSKRVRTLSKRVRTFSKNDDSGEFLRVIIDIGFENYKN